LEMGGVVRPTQRIMIKPSAAFGSSRVTGKSSIHVSNGKRENFVEKGRPHERTEVPTGGQELTGQVKCGKFRKKQKRASTARRPGASGTGGREDKISFKLYHSKRGLREGSG